LIVFAGPRHRPPLAIHNVSSSPNIDQNIPACMCRLFSLDRQQIAATSRQQATSQGNEILFHRYFTRI
jgi:hypothetical protein